MTDETELREMSLEHDRELLAVESLSKSYGGVRALRSADLHVRAGEIHALLGENGAGKSTLVKILAGATTKDSGGIRLDGVPVDFHSPPDSLRSAPTLISHHPTLAPHLPYPDHPP